MNTIGLGSGAQNRKYSGGRGAPILEGLGGLGPPEHFLSHHRVLTSLTLGDAGFAMGGGRQTILECQGGAPLYFAPLPKMLDLL